MAIMMQYAHCVVKAHKVKLTPYKYKR